MTLFFADLVREFSSSAGAGDFVLDGALPGHRRFAAVVPAGARFHYAIAGVTRPDEWETGEGELGSGGTLVRSALASSAGGGMVAFSAGLKTVALTVGATWFAEQDAAVNVDVTALQATIEGKADADHDHDADYQPFDATLTALAEVSPAADRLAYFTGPEAAAVAALTAFGRSLIDDPDAAAARATLGLGAAAVKGIGTSGDAVPVLNGPAAAWANGASFGGSLASTQTYPGPNPAPVLGNVDAARVGQFLTHNGTWGLLLGLDGSTGNSWVQAQRADGTATAYDLRLQPAGGNVDLCNGTVVASPGGLAVTGTCSVGGSQVLTSRRTGWEAPVGTATRTAFDTAAVTTEQLAERVKALIDDLATHGLIGS